MATYRVPDLAKFEWQKSVLDKDLLTPPGGEAVGNRYLINGVGAVAWVGQDYNIATCISISPTVWEFTAKKAGMNVWVADEAKKYQYSGSAWVLEEGHARQHAITSTDDHTSSATSGKMLKANANGLPVDATNTDTDVADAVTKKHTQNSDTKLNEGGANEITAAQAKEAYTKRATVNADLGTIDFTI